LKRTVLAVASALRQFSMNAGSIGVRGALAGAARGLIVPAVACIFASAAIAFKAPMFVMLAAAVLLVTVLGPLLYRLVYAPIANASILVLLIVSIAVHLALLGMGLYFFGRTGRRRRR
jgi:branched-chain amino acid transport system permease protein